MASVTSSNAVLTLSVVPIFSSPVQIQGFSTENVYTAEALEITETMMGMDGRLSFGKVFSPQPIVYSLQADSPSLAFFDQWWQYQQQQGEAYAANGIIRLKSVGVSYALTTGALRTYQIIPEAGKTLGPRRATIVWQSITPSPV